MFLIIFNYYFTTGSVSLVGNTSSLAFWCSWSGKRSFIEIDQEIFSMAILSLPLMLVEHLSVTGERMCMSTG